MAKNNKMASMGALCPQLQEINKTKLPKQAKTPQGITTKQSKPVKKQPKASTNAKENSPYPHKMPYNDDGIFNFTIEDYVPLVYALQNLDENINKNEQKLKTDQELYFLHTRQWKQYEKQYEQICSNFTKTSSHTLIKDTETLKRVTSSIRNYFSHYLHVDTCIKVIFEPYFIVFCDYLKKEALYTFNSRFPEQNQSEEIFAKIDAKIKQYFVDTNYNGCGFFLFLCAMLPKSRAYYFLSGLRAFRSFDNTPEEEKVEIDNIKKLLTVLSLPDSYNSQNTNQDIIVSLSILNFLSKKYAELEQEQNENSPNAVPQTNSTFIIRSLVDIIETNEILKDIKFARNGEYKNNYPTAKNSKERLQPSFASEDKEHELYINNNSTVIQFQDNNRTYRGALGVHALLLIVLLWIKDENCPSNKELSSSIKIGIKQCIDHCEANTLDTLADKFKLLIPKQMLEKKPVPSLDKQQLENAVQSKLDSWDRQYFSSSAKPHQKVRFIADWLNLNLKTKLNQNEYQELIYLLTAKEISKESIADFLSLFIPAEDFSAYFDNTSTIDSILAKIHADIKKEFSNNKEDESKLLEFAKKIKLRQAKEKGEYSYKENYIKKYLSKRISPNRDYFKNVLNVPDDILTSKGSFRKKGIDEVIFRNGTENIFNKFYSFKNKNNNNTKNFNIYCSDVILFGAAIKILNKRFSDENYSIKFNEGFSKPFTFKILYPIEIPNSEKKYKISIDFSHLGRHNLHLNPERMAAVIKNYWDKPQETIILYHKTEEQKEITCYNDLENTMEYERRILIQALLQFEKDLAEELGKRYFSDKNHVKLKEILERIGTYDTDTINTISEYRNKAYHQFAEKRFSEVVSPLHEIYEEIKKQKEEKKRNNKKYHQKSALKKEKLDKN